MRPFLKNYPFTCKEIFVVDKSRNSVRDPDFMLVAETRGKIRFKTKDKDVKFGYKTEIEEDYETALKIVQNEKENYLQEQL